MIQLLNLLQVYMFHRSVMQAWLEIWYDSVIQLGILLVLRHELKCGSIALAASVWRLWQ